MDEATGGWHHDAAVSEHSRTPGRTAGAGRRDSESTSLHHGVVSLVIESRPSSKVTYSDFCHL